jgi:hypothetical protein
MAFEVDAPVYLVGRLNVGDQHRILVAVFDQQGAPGTSLGPQGYLTIPSPPAPYTTRQVIQMDNGKLLLNGHNIEADLGEVYKLFQITGYPLTARSYFPIISKAP